MNRLRVGLFALIIVTLLGNMMVLTTKGGTSHGRAVVAHTLAYRSSTDVFGNHVRVAEARASRSEKRHALQLRRVAEAKARAAERERVRRAAQQRVRQSAPVVHVGWQVWAASSRVAALRNCESGGDYSIHTGNGYSGAYQFSTSTWQAMGGSGEPWQNPPYVQDQIAYALYERSGSAPWPVCGRYL